MVLLPNLTTTTTTTSTNPLDNTTTTYEVPRNPEGKIDLDAVLRQREDRQRIYSLVRR